MKLLVIISLIYNYSAFASIISKPHLDNNEIHLVPEHKTDLTLEKASYANIYADYLISEFDKILDQKILLSDDESMMSTEVYAKILSARSYLENLTDHNEKIKELIERKLHRIGNGKKINLDVPNQKLYNDVIKEIDIKAELIHTTLKSNARIGAKMPRIYPSIGRNGSYSGWHYPKNVWSLTFDDGPKPKTTNKIVDLLYKNNIDATFFMLAKNVKKFPDTAKYVKDARMEIGLHGFSHVDLRKNHLKKTLHTEITLAKKIIEDELAVKINLFRLPYGAGLKVKEIREKIKENEMIHVFWDVDSLDWKDKNPESVLKRVAKLMKRQKTKSGIILFHDIHDSTIKVTRSLIDLLKRDNLKSCTVNDMINFQNGKKSNCNLK